MNLGIVGGRDFSDKDSLYREVDEYRKIRNIQSIVSGVSEFDSAFRGADTLACGYAIENGLEYIGFPANWEDISDPCVIKYNKFGKPYNALAGLRRNTLIVQASAEIMAFWDGKSKGTFDTITKARYEGKNVIIINY